MRPHVGKLASSMPVEDLASSVADVDAFLAKLNDLLSPFNERVESFAAEDVWLELKDFHQAEVKKLRQRVERSKARLKRASAVMEGSRDLVAKRQALELEKLRAFIVASVRSYGDEDSKSIETIFAEVDADGDGFVQEKDFVEFLMEKCKSDLEAAKVQNLFKTLSGDDGQLGLEDFQRLLRVFNKVVDTTVMTTGISIRDSKVIRRLNINEVIEVYEGPKKEDSVDVMRIRGKALSDGQVGWVSVAGNQGTTYLEEGGNLYRALKPADLTKAFDVSEGVVRRLKAAEILEVVEWERTDEATGAVRIKARAKDDGAVGWATIKDDKGIAHFEVV